MIAIRILSTILCLIVYSIFLANCIRKEKFDFFHIWMMIMDVTIIIFNTIYRS